MKWKAGDIVIGVMGHNNCVVRQIMEVRETGVTWHYPDMPEKGQLPYKGWLGENSNDPHMERGWEFVENREISKEPYYLRIPLCLAEQNIRYHYPNIPKKCIWIVTVGLSHEPSTICYASTEFPLEENLDYSGDYVEVLAMVKTKVFFSMTRDKYTPWENQTIMYG